MKHFRTFAIVFLILLSYESVRADEVAAPAESATATVPAEAAAAAPMPAADEIQTVKAPEAPAPAAPATEASASAATTEVAAAPAIEAVRAPASAEPAVPAPAPQVKPSVEVVKISQKNKKWKNNGLRKVKTACEVMDNPDGKKIGLLKLDRKLWTDEIDKDGWYKVTRKAGPGFVKKECFE